MSGKHLLALALAGAVVASGAWAGEPVRAVLDRDVPQLLIEQKIPSVSIAQIVHGKVVLTAAYGAQSPGVPATAATLYNIASLTKPLTAETILRLASQGRLGLDDPMYRSWLDPDIANDPRAKLLTPRLALSHQTGFPNWREKTGLKFAHDPGTVGYSGEGYNYAARFVEKKLGQGFESLAQAALFDAAGLTSTAYTGKPWFEGRIAVPTGVDGVPLKPLIAHDVNAADLVYTTAGDYARFMTDVLKDEGLSPAIARERNRIQIDDRASNCAGAKAAAVCPDAIGFGLGWQILEFKGETLMMHSGKDDGVFTFAYLNRTTGDGAVILTNGEEGYKMVIPVLEMLGISAKFDAFLKSAG